MAKFLCDVKGGLHAGYGPTLGTVEAYNNSMDHKRAAQALAHKGQFQFRGIVDSLVNSGVGGTASVNYSEIAASSELGGARPIVTTSLINRATTANDVSDVRETLTSLASDTFVPNPVYNGDRNPLGTR